MPREIITLQVGQCGNQSTNASIGKLGLYTLAFVLACLKSIEIIMCLILPMGKKKRGRLTKAQRISPSFSWLRVLEAIMC